MREGLVDSPSALPGYAQLPEIDKDILAVYAQSGTKEDTARRMGKSKSWIWTHIRAHPELERMMQTVLQNQRALVDAIREDALLRGMQLYYKYTDPNDNGVNPLVKQKVVHDLMEAAGMFPRGGMGAAVENRIQVNVGTPPWKQLTRLPAVVEAEAREAKPDAENG